MTKFGKLVFTLILVAVLAVAIFFLQKKPVAVDDTSLPSQNTVPNIQNGVLGNKDDLVAFSILPNTKVHGILSYRGTIKGGYFFEGNILINILDTNKNVLKASNAVAKTDWMTAGPVDFEGNIDFSGLPRGSAYFEIHNDNASGLPENDKSILIPIVIDSSESKEFKKIIRANYSFDAPKNWRESAVNYNNCDWFSLVNDTSDGHRMAGEIAVNPVSCFDISKSGGKQEFTIKGGYYIISYYDDSTTPTEILETKEVYKRIVSTFVVK